MQAIIGQEFDTVINSHLAYDFLETHCTLIGRGSFNLVFAHPQFSNRVIKYNSDAEDGALAFAHYCSLRSNNPTLPVIYEFNNNFTHQLIIQEALCPLDSLNYTFVDSIANELEQYVHFVDWSTIYATKQIFVSAIEICCGKLTPDQISIVHEIHAIMMYFNGYYCIDISTENIMQRGSRMVIMDPLAVELNLSYFDDHADFAVH